MSGCLRSLAPGTLLVPRKAHKGEWRVRGYIRAILPFYEKNFFFFFLVNYSFRKFSSILKST